MTVIKQENMILELERLNDLLQRNLEAEKGYQTAYNNIANPQIKSFLQAKALKRQQFSDTLKAEMLKSGLEPEESTSILASLHRTWIDTKGILTGSDEVAILDECQRGEEVILKEYEDVILNANLPEKVQYIVVVQRAEIMHTLNDISNLKVALQN